MCVNPYCGRCRIRTLRVNAPPVFKTGCTPLYGIYLFMWERMDSNHQCRETADLQSAAITILPHSLCRRYEIRTHAPQTGYGLANRCLTTRPTFCVPLTGFEPIHHDPKSCTTANYVIGANKKSLLNFVQEAFSKYKNFNFF